MSVTFKVEDTTASSPLTEWSIEMILQEFGTHTDTRVLTADAGQSASSGGHARKAHSNEAGRSVSERVGQDVGQYSARAR